MKSDLIILAGGLGTRLQHILPGIPKPMAPINDLPFLQYLLLYIKKFNPKRIILSVGYENNQIVSYFGNQFEGIELIYSIENNPLGTGGAIKKSLLCSSTDNSFIINGDTFFDVDLNQMEKQHLHNQDDMTIAVKEMIDFNRYGSLLIENKRIINFAEKKFITKGFINAGIYSINNQKFLEINWPEKFSFETEFLEKYVDKLFFSPFYAEGYFIDIGIPEDYYKAQNDFKSLF
jgi:D-glycero-alpha-D-manno-heptose 1-phosphate guanylyltransferase